MGNSSSGSKDEAESGEPIELEEDLMSKYRNLDYRIRFLEIESPSVTQYLLLLAIDIIFPIIGAAAFIDSFPIWLNDGLRAALVNVEWWIHIAMGILLAIALLTGVARGILMFITMLSRIKSGPPITSDD